MRVSLADYCKRFHELFLIQNLKFPSATVWNYKKNNGFHPQFDCNSMVPLPAIPEIPSSPTLPPTQSSSSGPVETPLRSSDLPEILQDLQSSALYSSQISYIHRIPARPPSFESLLDLSLPSELHETLTQDLNIQKLYRHQAQAMRVLRYQSTDPRHVIVSTSTASGIPYFSSRCLTHLRKISALSSSITRSNFFESFTHCSCHLSY